MEKRSCCGEDRSEKKASGNRTCRENANDLLIIDQNIASRLKKKVKKTSESAHIYVLFIYCILASVQTGHTCYPHDYGYFTLLLSCYSLIELASVLCCCDSITSHIIHIKPSVQSSQQTHVYLRLSFSPLISPSSSPTTSGSPQEVQRSKMG